MAPETKRYDVGGVDRGNGRPYPDGTVLKLTETQAKAMGVADKVSKVTTTADDLAKVDRYEQAMTSQDRMREQETAAAETKKRTAAKDK